MQCHGLATSITGAVSPHPEAALPCPKATLPHPKAVSLHPATISRTSEPNSSDHIPSGEATLEPLNCASGAGFQSTLDPDTTGGDGLNPISEGENPDPVAEHEGDNPKVENDDPLAPTTEPGLRPLVPTDTPSPFPPTPTQDIGSAAGHTGPGSGAFVYNRPSSFITSCTIDYLEMIPGGQCWVEMVKDYLKLKQLPVAKRVQHPSLSSFFRFVLIASTVSPLPHKQFEAK